MVATVKFYEVMSSTYLRENFDSAASLLARTLYQGTPDRNHKLWNIVTTEIYILHMQVLLECCKNEIAVIKVQHSQP